METDRKRCPHCGKTKPRGAFHDRPDGRPQSWCRTCNRVANAEFRQTERHLAWRLAYSARPDVAARRRESDRRRDRTEKARERRRRYRATPRARLLACLRTARGRLRKATAPARAARLRELIDAYEREVARIDAALRGDVA